MKKIISAMTALCLCFGTFTAFDNFTAPKFSASSEYTPTTGFYEDTESNGTKFTLLYTKYIDHIEITKCGKTVNYPVIPDEILGLPVTVIGAGAFMDCDNMKGITLKDNVTDIGDRAFMNCTSLFSANLPSTLKNIGISAFENCKEIRSITIPEDAEGIGDRAFANCSSLSSIVIKNPDCAIDDPYDCGSAINNEISTNNVGMFSGTIRCYSNSAAYAYAIKYKSQGYKYELISPVSPGASTSGKYESLTFNEYFDHIEITGCDDSAADVVIPDNINGLPVTVICDYAFNGTSALASVTFPKTLKKIGIGAFRGCNKLTEITVPGSVEEIGCYAFENCKKLSAVKFSEGLKYIRNHAFCGCEALTEAELPESIERISEGAFHKCKALELITVLSPDCKIYNSNYTFSGGFDDKGEIYFSGTLSSYKEASLRDYAEAFSRNYKIIPDKPVTTTTTTVTTVTTKATSTIPPITKPVTYTKHTTTTTVKNSATATTTAVTPTETTTTKAPFVIIISPTSTKPLFPIVTTAKPVTTSKTSTEKPSSAQPSSTAKPTTTKPIESPTDAPDIDINDIETVLGDVNSDETVDASDASMVLMEYAAASTGNPSTLSVAQKLAADTNKDDAIDASDASTILMFYSYSSTGGTFSDMAEWLDSQ